jgi:hypothetical protein
VQASKRTPNVFALLNGHPKCANASSTGAGLKNFTTASGMRKTTTKPLNIRPAQTRLLARLVDNTGAPVDDGASLI